METNLKEMMTKNQKRLAVVGVAFVWVAAALIVDRYCLRNSIPW
jgi:hypothetical protein